MKWWKPVGLFILMALAVMLPAGEIAAKEAETAAGVYCAGQTDSLYDRSMQKEIEVPYSSEAVTKNDLFEKRVLYADTTQSPWKEYGNRYVYEQLSTQEQAMYDRLETESLAILTETKDVACITDATGTKIPTMNMLNYTECGLTREEAVDVAWLFFYNNPQYYFIENTIYFMSFLDEGSLGFKIYDEFQDGEIRSDYTVRVSEKLSAWVQDAGSRKNGYEKIKRAHDIVCDATVYRKAAYDQSISSIVLFGGDGVCTAYALCFEAICNKLGYPTILVTSSGHAWNMVELGGQWYQSDCTWDDTSTAWIYDYFLVSDSTIKSKDQNANHVLSAMWNGIVPSCPADYNDLKLEAECRMENGNEVITLLAGDLTADIYYTTDGTAPSAASEKYTGSFTVKNACTVRAIAISDGELGEEKKLTIHEVTIQANRENAMQLHGVALAGNRFLISEGETAELTAEAKSGYRFKCWEEQSEILSDQAAYVIKNVTQNRVITVKYSLENYKLTYKLRGGKGKNKNPKKYNVESTITLKNPKKKGYVFRGWYLNGKKVTKIENRVGDLVLRAKWKKVKG